MGNSVTLPFSPEGDPSQEDSPEANQMKVEIVAQEILAISERIDRSFPFEHRDILKALRRGQPQLDENIFASAFLLLYNRRKIVSVPDQGAENVYKYKFVSDKEDSVL